MDYMPDGTKRLKRIREFNKHAAEIAAGGPYDPERAHPLSDNLMEAELIALGYRVGVDTIRKTTRWYS